MAKQLSEASETIAVRGGYVDGNVVDPDKVEWLSDLPDRETLLAQVLGGMSAPLQGFANGLKSMLRGFASCVDQLREQREKEAG
jgi:large subunit ribosomal protein L10